MKWFEVPQIVVTRARGKLLREQALAEGCDVLDFSKTELLTIAAADELVCNGAAGGSIWVATTGENPDVREQVEKAQARRGLIPGREMTDAD